MNEPDEVFMTDAQIQELAYGIALKLPFSFAQLQRVEGVLKRIRAVYEGNGYEPTLDGEMWQPVPDGSAYRDPDGVTVHVDGKRLSIYKELGYSLDLPADLRLCKRTGKTLVKKVKVSKDAA